MPPLSVQEEIVSEILELLVSSNRIPKMIRYLIVALVCGFLIWIGLNIAISVTAMLIGKIIGLIMALLFLGVGIYWISKIRKSK